MKKYVIPTCKALRMESAAMLADSLGVYATKTTSGDKGGWTRPQGWTSEDWTPSTEE